MALRSIYTVTESNDTGKRHVYTVSRLNREARTMLAGHFLSIWVEGEISNLARPSSGHIYFTLKDDQAQVRCAMFRTQQRRLSFRPENGSQILTKAQVSLYEARGDYQLIVDYMEESGDGALRKAFDRLKQQLSDEGLFDTSRKKALPPVPNCIGIITSPSGAAVRDILTILNRRFPAIPVIIYPVAVQGHDASHQIQRAIETATQRQECDVLIIARGGGSLEDMCAFNEENVARAISRCSIPVVSGIGHETDSSIADFVADVRTATPSAAAETASPEASGWMRNLTQFEEQMKRSMQTRLENHLKAYHWLTARLQRLHPGKLLQDQAQRLDDLESRINRSVQNRLTQLAARVSARYADLAGYSPLPLIKTLDTRYQLLAHRLISTQQNTMESKRQHLAKLSRSLETVSPLATLSRGYSITARQTDGTLLRSAENTRVGEIVETRLANGSLICCVQKIRKS